MHAWLNAHFAWKYYLIGIENADGMMTQIKGRENEMIDALCTMQGRRIAQRSRTVIHKSAKREARKSMLDDDKTNLGFPPRPSNFAATQQTTITTQNASNNITMAAALATTAVWLATSTQHKQGTEAKSASDDAYWATSRSLVAFHKAESKAPSS